MKTADCHTERPHYALGKCKQCYHKELSARKNNSIEGKEYWRALNLKRGFGITIETYDKMSAQQNGACAICRKPQTGGRRLAVDHDHITGIVRGLLCCACNRAVGYLENENWHAQATKYLNEHNT